MTFDEFKKMFDKIDLKTQQRKAKKEESVGNSSKGLEARKVLHN